MTLKLAQGLTVPLDAMTGRWAILAQTGLGKSYTGMVMAEEVHASKALPFVAIDPTGAWWGLRTSADGKRAGLSVPIFGGDHADVPIDSTMGKTIAAFFLRERISMVIDLGLMTGDEQIEFMTAFTAELFWRNREPMHLFVDESDLFAPQQLMDKGHKQCLKNMIDLVRRGRGKGIGCTLITQRAASLSKQCLTQVDTLLVMGMSGGQDINAIEAWVSKNSTKELREEALQSLPTLKVGEAWVWSPRVLRKFKRVKIRKRRTYDSSRTPKVGETPFKPKTLAQVSLKSLGKRLEAAVDRVTADDPEALRAKVRKLERDMKRAGAHELTRGAALEASRQKNLAERYKGQVESHEQETNELRHALSQAHRVIREGERRQLKTNKDLARILQLASENRHVVETYKPAGRTPRKPTADGDTVLVKRTESRPTSTVNGLKKGENTMLCTLASFGTIMTRDQLGLLSGFTPSGGTFRNYLGTLKRHGYVITDNQGVRITPVGYTAANNPPPLDRDAILELWRGRLKKGERRMLDILLDAYPDAFTRERLGDEAGFEHTGGTFRNYLGTLKRMRLADVTSDGVCAKGALFA